MSDCKYEDLIKVTYENTNETRKDVKKILQDVAVLKIKSSYWGAIGGFIPLAIGLIIWYFKNLVK